MKNILISAVNLILAFSTAQYSACRANPNNLNKIIMKKYLYLFVLSSILMFSGCGSDDSDSSNSNLFLNINVNGTQYSSESLYVTGFGGEENCANNGMLFLQDVGQVENSNMYIECGFVHFENLIDFSNPQKNIVTNTRVTDINDLWELNFDEDVCSYNNDFSIIFEDKTSGDYLRLKPNSPRNHTITSVLLASEDNSEALYIVEGNFSAIFQKGSTDMTITGNYRIKIGVLK